MTDTQGTSESPPKATPISNGGGTAVKQKKHLPLPPKWVKVMSDRGPYYWNKELNKTQWKFPREEAIEFLKLQKSHGYINLPPSNSTESVTPPKSRSQNSQRTSKTLSNKKNLSPMTKRKSSTLHSNNSVTNGLKSSSVLKGELDCRPHPSDDEDTPSVPPPLMSCDSSDSPPPPIPARNYTDKDLQDLNEQAPSLRSSPGPEDSPPPPIPMRTELSTQLVTPPNKSNLTSHFIYNSNISDISNIGVTDNHSNNEPLLMRPPITNNTTSTNHTLYDEIPEPSNSGRTITNDGGSVQTNVTDTVVYDEVPDISVSSRNPARLRNQRSLDDRLIDSRPRLPDPVDPTNSSSTLIYDEVFDPKMKSASRDHHKPPHVIEPPFVPTEYNKLNFGQTNMAAALPSPVHQPSIQGLYDHTSSSNRPPTNDNNVSTAVYDEVPSDLSQRVISNDTPTINKDTPTTAAPVYNELDLSNNKASQHVNVGKVQSLPRNILLKHGVSNPPPTESPPPPPSSSSNATPLSLGDRPSSTLLHTRTPPSDKKLIKSQSLNPEKTPPPIRATPPIPANQSTSREVTPVPPIAAYEVVPINPSKPPLTNTIKSHLPSNKSHPSEQQPSDEIFMTVNHEAQLQRFQRFGGSLRSTNTPPLHSKRCATYDRTRSKNALHSSNPSLDTDTENYHHLNHRPFSSTISTLPRVSNSTNAKVDSTYSTLQRDNESESTVQKKQGDMMATLSQDSVVELIHAPNAPSPDIKRREHLYEEFKDDVIPTRRHSNPTLLDQTPMIYAPDHPSTDMVKRKKHVYEDCDKDLDQRSSGTATPPDHVTSSPQFIRRPHPHADSATPTLVWDNDLNKASKGFHKEVIDKPSSVTNKDYERRLMKLENHEYNAIDIPEWPGVQPTLISSPTDIKQVIKDSWLTPSKDCGEDLPPGWTKELNEQGQEFYWHIPTGKLQYIKPTAGSHLRSSKSCSPGDSDTTVSSPTTNTTFAAEYWGSCAVSEDLLVKGRSVQVVLNCIQKLIEENASYTLYGGLKQRSQIHIKVTHTDLQWLSIDSNNVLVSQPINKIRVWGVGQENEREFGYIARNMATKKHFCHVFMCDIAAIGIAQAMLNSHNTGGSGSSSRRPSMDVDLSAGDIGNNNSIGGGTVLVQVPPKSAPRERAVTNAGQDNTVDPSNTNPASVTSTEEESNSPATSESYKRLEATYIGFTDVQGAHGIAVLNEAVSQLSIAKSRWLPVYVDIATSHIKILDKKNEQVLKEHRVRFLSFLGIATDDQYCGYVVDNGDNQFLFHGFHCTPNADRLCLALHAACQARYQRVIDAHLNDGELGNIDSSIRQKRSLLSRIGSWKSLKQKEPEEDTKPSSSGFIVQFLGYEMVPKPNGVDSIKEPLQKVSRKTSGIHLVELVVTPTGFTINDPQKKHFASKHIHSKKICYCAKVRSYFVFIAREGNKYYCYMFTESDVPLASITDAINQIMN